MKICTYLGHHAVYDAGVEDKLRGELGRILAAGEDLLFYFHEEDMLSRLCKRAVDALRGAWPARRITTVYVATPRAAARLDGQGGFDLVLSLPATPERHFSVEKRRARRWVFARADLLFQYTYDLLAEWEREYFRQLRARAAAGMAVVDLTEPGTAARLETLMDMLPERNRYVLEQVRQGRTLRAVGEELGLSAARAHELRHSAQFMLRTQLAADASPDPDLC